MRFHELIIEGSGLKAARSGEVYVDQTGKEYKFQNWNWQFPDDSNQFDSPESLEAGILAVTNNDQNKIAWVNQPRGAKSFAYAVFKSDEGDEKWIGKFYRAKNPNNTILDKEVKAVLGLSAGGKSSTVKAEAALQPGQLGVADNRARSISGVIKAVSSHEKGEMLSAALNQAASNQPVVFTGGGPISGALQDDFCEVLAPVAMITSNSVVTGQLEAAVSDVFKGGKLDGATITFPPDQNNPLIDSFITKGGVSLGVSHKGKQGAKATITNIWKAKEEAAQNATGQAYIKKFKEAVYILDVCQETSGLLQPIILAKRYKLIDDAEAAALEEAVKVARDPKYQLAGDPANPNVVIKKPLPADLKKVPPALKRLFLMGGYKSGSYVSFLCLARVAHLVANHINTDTKIDFGEAIRSFLNSSAMVQAKSAVSVKGSDALLKSINIVYPPNFQEKAKIESNGYSGTQVKGKFSFSLPTT